MSEKKKQGEVWLGIFIVCLGLFFLARNFGWLPHYVDLGDLWPIALIVVGAWFIFGRDH
jgi:hypothetical protein